jgi:HSP20 family protein
MKEVERIHPPVNLVERKEAYVIEIWLPGVEKDMVEVIASDEEIIVSGYKIDRPMEERIYYQVERQFGDFKRAIKIPSPFNKKGIKAVMKEGVLKIYVPKVEERREKFIKVEIEEG